MSSTRRAAKWLSVQWASGGQSVVNLTSVISPLNETDIVGSIVIAEKVNGSSEAATIIGVSRNRQELERQISPKMEPVANPDPDPHADINEIEEPEDFCPSGSSWAPSDEEPSDDEEVNRKPIKVKVEQFNRSYSQRRRSKNLKPSHRADAVNAIFAKCRKRSSLNNESASSTLNKGRISNSAKKIVPDSTRGNNSPAPIQKPEFMNINVKCAVEFKKSFLELFRVGEQMLESFYGLNPIEYPGNVAAVPAVKPEADNTLNQDIGEDECEMSDRSEDLNRSDDNVLITNKYDRAVPKVLKEKDNIQNQKENLSEWIPIGTGTTLIHKDQYVKVNWRSYTIATRTLLLAAFPRRVLATHSLTGKRSPAFQHKPAKMCLDPKIVSDVIIEITDRFHVKENLVRSIITTKCADECKMMKTRLKQKQNKQKRKTLPAKQEVLEAEMQCDQNETF